MPSQQTRLPLCGSEQQTSWNPAIRIMEQSPRYLSDVELLEIVLRSHLPADRAASAARELIGKAPHP